MIFMLNSISFFENFPVGVKIMWLLIVVFSLVILVSVFNLKRLRHRLRKEGVSRRKYINKCEKQIVNYLYAREEGVAISRTQRKIITKLRRGLYTNFKRKLVVQILIKLLGEISGKMTDSIRQLYIELGLLKQAKSKLKHRTWHISPLILCLQLLANKFDLNIFFYFLEKVAFELLSLYHLLQLKNWFLF